MLAYTNLDNTIEDMPSTEWRRGTNTRNTSAKNLNGDNKAANSENPLPPTGKFLDTSATLKRSDIKDHIKSVKQSNLQKRLVGSVSGGSGSGSATAAGPSTLDS